MNSERWVRWCGAAALVSSAVGFLAGLATLYVAEGPNAPDLWVYLASPSGRADLNLSTFALTAAVVLLFVGIVLLSSALAGAGGAGARLARYLAAVGVALFVGFLSLQYALVAVLNEGVDPGSQEFKVLVLQQHAAADWAGWTAIVLLAGSFLALGPSLLRERRPATGWAGIVAGCVGLALIPIGFGFLFTVVAAAWAVVAAIELVRAGRASGRA